jgi:hypothetical protein
LCLSLVYQIATKSPIVFYSPNIENKFTWTKRVVTNPLVLFTGWSVLLVSLVPVLPSVFASVACTIALAVTVFVDVIVCPFLLMYSNHVLQPLLLPIPMVYHHVPLLWSLWYLRQKEQEEKQERKQKKQKENPFDDPLSFPLVLLLCTLYALFAWYYKSMYHVYFYGPFDPSYRNSPFVYLLALCGLGIGHALLRYLFS